MVFSYLIVTHNRVEDLSKTLANIYSKIDINNDEVLVYIDACEETEKFRDKYPWVYWYSGTKRISASPARAFLYNKAKGRYLIGLDDDAHIITPNHKKIIQKLFENPKIGVLAFKEVRGIYESDQDAISKIEKNEILYETNDFIGCGFAIKKVVYDATRGFPIWIDIYGEEPCLSLEVMNIGYELWYTNQIAVNHRVDLEKRKLQGKNYFRFQKQLKNSFFIYYNYYEKPWFKISKLIFHNFKKYALSDIKYFKLFCSTIVDIAVDFNVKSKFRMPLQESVLKSITFKKGLKY